MSTVSEDNGSKDASKKRKTLSLVKTVSAGQIQQKFSHGRSKSVEVEVRKKRRFSQGADGTVKEMMGGAAASAASSFADEAGTQGDERSRQLQLLKAAEEQKKREEEERARQAEEQRVRDEERERLRLEQEQREQEEREERERRREKEKSRKQTLEEAVESVEDVDIAALEATEHGAAKGGKLMLVGEKGRKLRIEDEKEQAAKTKARKDGGDRRHRGKLTVAKALDGEGEERVRSLASLKRAREKARRQELGDGFGSGEKQVRDVVIPEFVTVQELANRMAERSTDVVRELMKMGMLVKANDTIDADTAELIVGEFGHNFKRVTEADVENILAEMDAAEESSATRLLTRPPVVTIMGHVDHGKTSLLDALRQTDVVAGEAGGITQHIGAYQIVVAGNKKVTFLDTPGHEAFTSMRARGAQATDIVVLVVAADDGVKEQTKEAISHAKAANVPIIVAINKIDKPGADPSRVINELLNYDLVAESLGGDIMTVEVSAKQKTNLDQLVEGILIQAEMLDLRANEERSASGMVVESEVDKGKGTVATFLVQKGTLRVGDLVIAGDAMGRVRAMHNDRGMQIAEALPAQPVSVLGLDTPPIAGEIFHVVADEKQARDIIDYRVRRDRDKKAASEKRGSLEQLFLKAGESGIKELNVIIKADVQGSMEAIAGSLAKLENDEVKVRMLHGGVGGITESDAVLAHASGALIVGFNVRANKQAKEFSEREGVDIRYYSVIYDLVDDVKKALSGLLEPIMREQHIGNAEIREVFNITKQGKVAGCYVTNGVIKRGAGVRLLRDNVVIYEGKLKTLKRFKDDAKEVSNNLECGMALENYDDIKVGDVLEAFELIQEIRTL